MAHVELVLLFLLVAVAALTWLARVIDVPHPILLRRRHAAGAAAPQFVARARAHARETRGRRARRAGPGRRRARPIENAAPRPNRAAWVRRRCGASRWLVPAHTRRAA